MAGTELNFLVLSQPFYLCAEYTVDIFLGQAD